MSALTTNERDGLDEVFLSIHSHTDKYKKIKETKTSQFILNFTKKKKNLSK